MDKLIAGARELGIDLSPEQIDRFSVYYREIIDWNNRFNLTRITEYEAVQTGHFLDSLTAAALMEKDREYRIIDVGSGAGLPGIPLKIWSPALRLTLLEATGKKTVFLQHVVDKLGLTGVAIVNRRAEEAGCDPRYRERFDFVLSRAVAPMAVLAELTVPFCKISGRVIAYKKGDIAAEMAAASNAIGKLGGRLGESRGVAPDLFPDQRRLIVIDKIAATPKQYPRRPGMPSKSPL